MVIEFSPSVQWGRSYFKLNKSLFEDEEYERIVDEAVEEAECDVAFFSKLEDRKKASDGINQLAEKQDGDIYTDKENIFRIAIKFYKNLYTSYRVNKKMQEKLLWNIKPTLSKEARVDDLDAPITAE